jgi:hypothetical protein
VKGHEARDPRQPRERQRVVHRAVSPADVARVLLASVLGVVEQQVDAARQVEAGRPLGLEGEASRAERRLVVGQVGGDTWWSSRRQGRSASMTGNSGGDRYRRSRASRSSVALAGPQMWTSMRGS